MAFAHFETLLKTQGHVDHKPTTTELAILASSAAQVTAIRDLEKNLIAAFEELHETLHDCMALDDIDDEFEDDDA